MATLEADDLLAELAKAESRLANTAGRLAELNQRRHDPVFKRPGVWNATMRSAQADHVDDEKAVMALRVQVGDQ